MNRKDFKEYIEFEVYRPYMESKGRMNIIDRFWCKYISPESNSIYLVRKKMLYESLGGVFFIFSRIIHMKLMRRYGIHINEGTQIGRGLRIAHPTSIVITECTIGDNFTIYQNCTIGQKFRHSGLVPSIGNNVTMYANSSIIGEVNVTDNVKIGANACLVSNAEEPGIYIGVPAKKKK